MVGITVEFPLGVYHAQSAAQSRAEWPPSPLRLVGALLAAAHVRREGEEIAADRELIQMLCDAPAPQIFAPRLAGGGSAEDKPGGLATEIRGPTRWVPRNYFNTAKGGRQQAEASKVGVAMGDRSVRFVWPELELSPEGRDRLGRLAEDVAFLGTSRSPVVAYVSDTERDEGSGAWIPRTHGLVRSRVVRVPNASTIAAFDRRHDARRSDSGKPEKAGIVPGIAIGDEILYSLNEDLNAVVSVFDPRHWGDALVLAIDDDRSDARPKTAASYLLARAARRTILGAFGPEGSQDEAPPILRGRGAEPHCAIVPLADIWHPKATGNILGLAIVLPSASRYPSIATQLERLEQGVARTLGDQEAGKARFLAVPQVGRVFLRSPDPSEAYKRTLDWSRYVEPSRTWRSATPVIHSRWRKDRPTGLLDQVAADCAHVGLPAPKHVSILRGAGFPAAAARTITGERVPKDWRKLLGGPSSHLEIEFEQPVAGPVLLGRARHFGLGLMVPRVRPATGGGGDN